MSISSLSSGLHSVREMQLQVMGVIVRFGVESVTQSNLHFRKAFCFQGRKEVGWAPRKENDSWKTG